MCDLAGIWCDPLRDFFNASWREGFVPSVWKKASVICVTKIQSPNSVQSNLRPISLTATVNKVFEKLIGQHIIEALADGIDPRQFDAFKRTYTGHVLTDISSCCYEALNNDYSVRTLFIDYAKAFDHIHRDAVKLNCWI